ncbi:MAG: prepilin peptidase [Akkermansia sp.]|nr:prepilin peptidase [Akkermansia sp.]
MSEQLDLMVWEIARQQPWLMPLIFALFGACVGSFLNVVIYRIPRGLSVNEPRRSFCPSCHKEIPWYLNLPIISWLLLRGKSACCGKRISIRYWLVEVACALLFAGIAHYIGEEQTLGLIGQVMLCGWAAIMLAMLCIDWEQMIVLPGMAITATIVGLLAVLADTLWFYETTEYEAAFLMAAGSAIGAFVLLKLVALLGRMCFGHKKQRYEQPRHWQLRQAEDDLELRIGDTTYLWSELFMEENNRVELSNATVSTHPGAAAGALRFTLETLTLPDGNVLHLEDYDSLQGECNGLNTRKEAMGSGDAWIAMAIGITCGWEGSCFALVAGTILGLVWAIIARVRKGEPMPFGPALIAGAWLYLFCGREWVYAYLNHQL